jgi:protein arginine N-methyltransferase 3
LELTDHVQDLNLQVITPKALSFSSPFSLSALDFPTSPTARKAAGPYFSTKPHQTRVYARAFILWFDTFFSPRGEMVPPETPVKIHSDEVDVGDVIKLRRRKTTNEKRRGGLRSSSLVAERNADGESRPSEVESPRTLVEEPVEEREESFSTGPFSKETHWKQVVFLLKEPIELDRGAWLLRLVSM